MRLLPLGLVLKAGTWYLVAQNGKSIRTYRVANIENAEDTSEPFVTPKSFDLAAHWEKACRAYEEGLWRGRADIRLSPKGFALLSLLGSHIQQAAEETAKPESNGWVSCTIPIESDDQGVRELMRLCDEAEVIGPPALREKFVSTLAALLSRYSSGTNNASHAGTPVNGAKTRSA